MTHPLNRLLPTVTFNLVGYWCNCGYTYYILTDSVYFEFYSGKYSEARIYELMNFRKEWVWILYPIKVIVQLVILQIPAMILYLGLYLAKYEIGYKKVFDVVLTSEYIFFIPLVIKIFWFSYQPVTMETVRLFSPLSLFSLFDPELLQEWLYYPFKVLNLFEVGLLGFACLSAREASESGF